MATIREMTLSDLEAVYELECLLFKESAWPKEVLLKDMILFHFHVLEEDGVILGYISMAMMGEIADILNVGVHPDCRKKGYGTLLMKAMMALAWKLEATSMSLEVRVSNVAAIGLYQSLGFKKVYTRKQYYADGEDAYVMVYEKGVGRC